MLVYVLIVIIVIMSLTQTILWLIPQSNSHNDMAFHINKNNFSRAVDYWLDKLVLNEMEKNNALEPWCYRLWYYIDETSKKDMADTVKMEFIAPKSKCNNGSLNASLVNKFGGYERIQWWISEFMGGETTSSHDLLVELDKVKLDWDFSSWNPKDKEVQVYKVKISKVAKRSNWTYEALPFYEFVGWRNS